MSSFCLRCKIARQYIWNNQVVTPLMCRYIYYTLTISFGISSSGNKPINWSCLTSISYGFWWRIFNSPIYEGRHNTPKLDRYCATQLTDRRTGEYLPQGYLFHSRYWVGYQKTPINEPTVTPENNNKTPTLPQSKLHSQESSAV